MRIVVFLSLFIAGSCSYFPSGKLHPTFFDAVSPEFSGDGIRFSIKTRHDWDFPPVWPDSASDSQMKVVIDSLLSTSHDEFRENIEFRNAIPSALKKFSLARTYRDRLTVHAVYSLDLPAIQSWLENNYLKGHLYFGADLYTQDSLPVFAVSLPCEDINVPTNPLFLPNSPRDYRNGVHRGIDFQADWGTPFRSIADGTVIRADHGFEEIAPDQWLEWTSSTGEIGRTPDDLFYNIFMGRALIIDHGFNLFPGFRAISIYAHLSEINDGIKPGTRVLQGQVLGMTGNSGTLPATRNERDQSHLHLEIILQGKNGDIFLGQDTDTDDLLSYFETIFIP